MERKRNPGTTQFELVIAGLDPAIHCAAPLHGPPAQASEATPFRERLCPVVTTHCYAVPFSFLTHWL